MNFQVLFYGTFRYRYETNGVLGPLLNGHPLALKHTMSALMHFYIGTRPFFCKND